jgi:deuterolysin
LNHKDAWITVPAGQSITVNHKIGFDYDFVTAGTGKYTFEPANTFQFGPTPAETTRVQTSSVDINVTEVEGKVEIQQTTPVCNDGNRRNVLAASLSEARALAGGAASDVRSHPNSGQYSAYFGNNNRDTVWWNFDRIAGDLASSGVRK